MIKIILLTIFALLAASSSCLVSAQLNGGCDKGCKPWLTGSSCAMGQSMKLRLLVDASPENVANYLKNATHTEIGYGFCPTVDQLQAFQMPNSTAWAAGDLKSQNFSTLTASPAYMRIYGAVGIQDTELIPSTSYDSSAMIFDPNQTCADGRGYLVANFLVINFTLSNGAYRLVSSFNQAVQVGFQPTCDASDTCLVDPASPCIGPSSGRKNCAVCVTSFAQLLKTNVQAFASYYGTDANGRRMQSGSSNPLNFLQLSSTGVFNALKDDISGAVNTVQDNVPQK
jgi:hypothetical protein